MTSSDDSSLVNSVVIARQWSGDLSDEQSRAILDDNEDNDHDEGINDEPQLDSEEDETLTPVLPTDSK